MTPQDVAQWFRIEERPAEMLLTGCAGLGLLCKQNGRYCNTPLAEKFLVRAGHYYFGGFVNMLNRRLYSGWDKLPEALRTNRPTTWDADKQRSLFEGADPAMMQTFLQAMHSLSIFTARALGEAVDFTTFRKLLDVGGGSGAFDIEALPAISESFRHGLRPAVRDGDRRAKSRGGRSGRPYHDPIRRFLRRPEVSAPRCNPALHDHA